MTFSGRHTSRIVVMALVSCGLASVAAAAPRLVLDGVTVVDTRTGKLTPNRAVVVEGDTITRIVPAGSVKAAAGDRRIDARGKFVTPGFNDMHAHPLNPGDTANQLRMMLSMGITGFRQMSGSPELLAARRAGTLMPAEAPTLLATPGSLLLGPNAATPALAVAEVRRQKAQGADFIKAISLAPAALFAAHAEAKADGLTVTGHLSPLIDPREAAEHGMDGIEHLGPGDALLLGCSSREAEQRAAVVAATPPQSSAAMALPGGTAGATMPTPGDAMAIGLANPIAFTPTPAILSYGPVLDSYDAAKCRSLAGLLAARGIWQTPTLARVRAMEFGDDAAYENDPNLRYISPTERRVWRIAEQRFRASMTEQTRAILKRLFAAQLAMTKLFWDNHVPMMAGDDTAGAGWVVPGYGLHNEFDLLAEAGLSPLAILQMTTLNPARYLHREATMGVVEPGKAADLVLLDADPTVAVTNLHKIGGLVHGGRYYSAEDLAAIRQQVALAQR